MKKIKVESVNNSLKQIWVFERVIKTSKKNISKESEKKSDDATNSPMYIKRLISTTMDNFSASKVNLMMGKFWERQKVLNLNQGKLNIYLRNYILLKILQQRKCQVCVASCANYMKH